MILVRHPAVALLFQQGNFTAADTQLVARSLGLYSAAIWAFGLQQILNRAYYALHDTTTPLLLGIANLLINTLIELPLLWTPLGESGMAVGTAVAFSLQALVMVWMLNRKAGGLGLSASVPAVAKMLAASVAMALACLAVKQLPLYPTDQTKQAWAMQLLTLMTVGGGVYFAACAALGMNVLESVRRKKIN